MPGVVGAGGRDLPATLESVEPAGNDASGQWASSLTKWTAWNHVRTAAALQGAASLALR
jgi:uncharacterized membrane protein